MEVPFKRERENVREARRASASRLAGVKKNGGEERVGRGMGGRKKGELGGEDKGRFSFRAFLSLPFLRLSCKLRRTRPIPLATSGLICAFDK